MKHIFLMMFAWLVTQSVYAQKDTATEELIDFSQFEQVEESTGTKRYCTNKVLGISPNKLISVGYDYQAMHHFANYPVAGPEGHSDISSAAGLRLMVNYPIISNTKGLITLGGNYWRTAYSGMTNSNNNYVIRALKERGLTTIGINSTVFKPLNEKYFLLGFVSADANGDYTLSDDKLGDYLTAPKISAAVFFGKKRNDRSILAFGVSRTYRPGAKGIIPLIIYNHTFENRKWGIESVFPARAALRRTFNPRNLLFFGYELEGNSYQILNRGQQTTYGNLELRRSEIRPRITYEFALKGFIWLSAQVGYRINYNFNIDNSDKLRLLGSDAPYYMENKLSNPLYFQISLNLVSP
ncbi:MAG: DUF6268 family outer membrane beta-barrel protein [Bacteroidia bacterium]